MTGAMRARRVDLVGAVAFVVLLAACTGGEGDSDPGPTLAETTSTIVASTSSSPPPSTTRPPQERWIGIAGDRFIDTRTGETFVPSGVNLLLKTGGGGGDKLFARYDPAWVDAQLEQISDLGFNTVRFFLDMCMACTTDGDGVKAAYLDDLADLLTRLEAHGLVAFPTSNDVPDPGFSERLPCCEPFGGYRNSLYLSPDGHEIAVGYWTALLVGLQERGAPTHHVLGWQLTNEQFVLRNVAPISSTQGSVTTADGLTYDLADDAAVAEMVVANLRAYITTVGDAIRAVDDGALVSMGFFSAEDPEAGRFADDNRWVVPGQILSASTLDFVDLHAYPGLGGTWPAIANAYGLTGEPLGYPLLLGEYGAFEQAYPDPNEAAAAMARWQAASCEWGFGGWLIWFWGADKDDEVVTADAFEATVGRAVSPLERADPCDAGPYRSANLALERPVTASAEENADYAAIRVVDGSDAAWWSAAAGPPQWVEIDLEAPATVGRVEVLIGPVSPKGPQTHRVLVSGADLSERVVGEVSVDARAGEWLVVEFEPVPDVRRVKVETVVMDGWVIIHEVKVFAD